MQWLQIIIQTQDQYAEQLSEQLEVLGASSVTFQDSANHPVFELKPGDSPLWEQVDVIGLFTADSDMQSIIKQLREQIPTQAWLNECIVPLEEKNWDTAWMEHFEPLAFGNNLWVCPSWKQPPDPQAVNVVLDPGMAFGTGYHATTALILEWLANHDLTNKSLIDYGCGSGILGIAALKLGAHQVISVDLDPIALETTVDNADKNGIGSQQLTTYSAEDCPDYPADIVLANILAEPLHNLCPVLSNLVKPQGLILLSGITQDQVDALLTTYAPYFTFDQPIFKQEWALLIGKYNKNKIRLIHDNT